MDVNKINPATAIISLFIPDLFNLFAISQPGIERATPRAGSRAGWPARNPWQRPQREHDPNAGGVSAAPALPAELGGADNRIRAASSPHRVSDFLSDDYTTDPGPFAGAIAFLS
jgi:hypothetical protein